MYVYFFCLKKCKVCKGIHWPALLSFQCKASVCLHVCVLCSLTKSVCASVFICVSSLNQHHCVLSGSLFRTFRLHYLLKREEAISCLLTNLLTNLTNEPWGQLWDGLGMPLQLDWQIRARYANELELICISLPETLTLHWQMFTQRQWGGKEEREEMRWREQGLRITKGEQVYLTM